MPGEAFEFLRAEGVLDASLADAMQGWAGLRNLLTHLYLEVDHARIHEILCGEHDELERYATSLARAVAA